MACSSTLANIHLSSFDAWAIKRLQAKSMMRYIDDGLSIVKKGLWNQDSVASALCGWHACINIDVSAVQLGSCVHFLDVEFYIVGSYLRYRTFRKEVNSYDYLPVGSAHPSSIWPGIIAGECMRLLQTNSCKENYEKELNFFRKKICKRGVTKAIFDRAAARYSWENITISRKIKPDKKKNLSLNLRLKYIPGLRSNVIKHRLKKIDALLPKDVNARLLHSVGVNLFRRFHKIAWKAAW